MSNNLVSCVNRETKNIRKETKQLKPFGEGTSSARAELTTNSFSTEEVDKNNGAHGQRNECRICHEADFVENMESPCSCNGSLKPYNGYTVTDQDELVIEHEQLRAEMRIAIIHTLVLISGAIMTMKYAYDQVEAEHDGLGDIASAFASTHIFLVRLMAAICWIINLVISWRDRRPL